MSERVSKSIRKIIQIGDSSGIILPKEYLQWQGLKRGDKVELFYNNIIKIKTVNEKSILQELGEEPKYEEEKASHGK